MPWTLLMRPTVILGLLLALSVGANALLFKARDRALARVATVAAERDQARSAGQACSDATRRLRDEASERAREVARAALAAREAARLADARSDATLTSRPSVAGDACASALDLSRRKAAGRRP